MGAAPLAPAPAPTPWWEKLSAGAFVDTYYSQNWNNPRPGVNANRFHPYDQHTGFGLAWFGLDLALQSDNVGMVAQVRLGPSTPNLALNDAAVAGGVGSLQNAYAQWKPGGKEGSLTLIAGKFDTVFGAEVAASQLNANYTRGALYNLVQPFFHTGLRADISVSSVLGFKLLAVNGWNNTIDNNRGKSFGGQLGLTPSDRYSFYVGWMGGPEQSNQAVVHCDAGSAFDATTQACAASSAAPASDNTVDDANADNRWRHIVDLIVDLKPADTLRVVLNGDYAIDELRKAAGPHLRKKQEWYGASLIVRYKLTEVFAAAARGERIRDRDGYVTGTGKDVNLTTATLTLEAAPTPFLLVRVDQRVDLADDKVFLAGVDGAKKQQVTTTLGLVAHTD